VSTCTRCFGGVREVRRKVSCPDCGLGLIEMPDLFGAPRFAHPEGKCIPINQSTERHLYTSARCEACKGWFAQRVRGHRRSTCSEECLACVKVWNLAKGRKTPRKPHPTTYKWSERYRGLWQRKAERQDAKLARCPAIARNGTVEAPKPLGDTSGRVAA
jgi:hypothetical protein